MSPAHTQMMDDYEKRNQELFGAKPTAEEFLQDSEQYLADVQQQLDDQKAAGRTNKQRGSSGNGAGKAGKKSTKSEAFPSMGQLLPGR